MDNINELQKRATQIRIDVLKAINKAKYGFVGSIMSSIDILVALYYGDLGGEAVLRFDPKKPGWDGQDYFVLGKSYAAIAQYAILADLGFLDKRELDYFAKPGSLLQAKANMKVPGVCAPVADSGYGLSIALGMALALKADRKPNYVYTLLDNQELQCGQVWEAAMAASHYNLNNLVLFIDDNKLQHDGFVRSVMTVDMVQAKFEAFGWKVLQVRDGHDYDMILNALNRVFTTNRQPVCVWCHTVSGKGIEFAEGKAGYNSVTITDGELEVILPKLEASLL